MQGFLDILTSRYDQLLELVIGHIGLTVISILIAVIVGVPLGILITKNKKLATVIIGFANLMQAIPSLALLGFLVPIVGIGSTPAIIMVVLYSILPIVKNTYTGLMNIDPGILEVSKGIGLTKHQTLRLVTLPLAVPIIMTGIRISAVTAVGLMTIAAFVGAGGLGFLVFAGVASVDTNLILLGAIPAAMLALIIDFAVGKVENAVIPNGILNDKGVLKRKNKNLNATRKKMIVGVIVLILVFLGVNWLRPIRQQGTLTIGSKAFTEQLILGNILADLIEYETDIQVNRQLNLGGTQIVFEAMIRGDIDLYIEYSGTAYSNILNHDIVEDIDAAIIFETVVSQLYEVYNIRSLAPLGFNNTFAIVVTSETAQQYGLVSISDFAQVSSQMIFAPTIEFTQREDGMIGMQNVYDMTFGQLMPMDDGLRYTAVMNGNAAATSAFSTDGIIADYELVTLEDDLNFFLPYYAFVMIRSEALERYPELEGILLELEGRISAEMMQELNAQVDIHGRDPRGVAHDFLVREGFISQ